MAFFSDETTMTTIAPVLFYWLYAGLYQLLSCSKWFDRYRLHTREEEEKKNAVAFTTVVKGVLVQQALQMAIAQLYFSVTGAKKAVVTDQPTIPIQILQMMIAMFMLDTWQYLGHRYMHQNKFLFRHVHSVHHRLVVPYAVGALYNHPVEAVFVDTAGGVVAFFVPGMTPKTGTIFVCLATMKAIDDHCGLIGLPAVATVFHLLGGVNSAYHDIHHQLQGIKYNYSQPFFPLWDKLLGTHMPYVLVKRAGGGYEARLEE